MSKRTAYLTGGTGFIGFHIARLLSRDGWRVVALHRPGSDLSWLGSLDVELVAGDLADRDTTLASVPEAPDAIFHVAGNVSFDSANDAAQNQANVDGTCHVLEAARERGCGRFIYTSTGATFGLQEGWVTEDSPSNAMDIPINYFRTKTIAEDAVRTAADAGLDAVILNPANVVGPYDKSIWTPFVLAIAEGSLPGVGPGAGSFCHIDEVARAHVKAFTSARAGDRYLLAGDVARYAEVGNLVANMIGATPPPVYQAAPPGMTQETFELMSHVQQIDCSKACDELGFHRVPVATMFQDLIDWLRSDGRLA